MSTLTQLVDEFGQVRGADAELCEAIAQSLRFGPLVMSWCDNHGTRMTVLMAIPQKIGLVPGLNPRDGWLYVAVENYSTYGFAIKDEPLAPDYIAEKLGKRDRVNPTWEQLAELVGGVRIALVRQP
jgi:hypothetical protein